MPLTVCREAVFSIPQPGDPAGVSPRIRKDFASNGALATYGRPRGNSVVTGTSCATQVPPIVIAEHPGAGHTSSIGP